ncbi:hypothetical protein ABIC65_002128 [Sphingomonas trueperi]
MRRRRAVWAALVRLGLCALRLGAPLDWWLITLRRGRR